MSRSKFCPLYCLYDIIDLLGSGSYSCFKPFWLNYRGTAISGGLRQSGQNHIYPFVLSQNSLIFVLHVLSVDPNSLASEQLLVKSIILLSDICLFLTRVLENPQYWRAQLGEISFLGDLVCSHCFAFRRHVTIYLFFLAVSRLETIMVYFSGIVTRRPLVLQLYQISQGEQEYAEFSHLPRRKFTDFGV